MDTNLAMQKAQATIDQVSRERRAQALRMFQGGKKYKEIGEALGVTRERARQLVSRAMQEAK